MSPLSSFENQWGIPERDERKQDSALEHEQICLLQPQYRSSRLKTFWCSGQPASTTLGCTLAHTGLLLQHCFLLRQRPPLPTHSHTGEGAAPARAPALPLARSETQSQLTGKCISNLLGPNPTSDQGAHIQEKEQVQGSSPKTPGPGHAPNQGRDCHHTGEEPKLEFLLQPLRPPVPFSDSTVTTTRSRRNPTSHLTSALAPPTPSLTFYQGSSCQCTLGEDAACVHFRYNSPNKATGYTQTE